MRRTLDSPTNCCELLMPPFVGAALLQNEVGATDLFCEFRAQREARQNVNKILVLCLQAYNPLIFSKRAENLKCFLLGPFLAHILRFCSLVRKPVERDSVCEFVELPGQSGVVVGAEALSGLIHSLGDRA